jgi:hypothetical protein
MIRWPPAAAACVACTWTIRRKIGHTIGVGYLIVKRRGGVGDGVGTFDCLVKCTVLGDILDDNELKTFTVEAELSLRKALLDNERTVPRTEYPASRYFLMTQVAR